MIDQKDKTIDLNRIFVAFKKNMLNIFLWAVVGGIVAFIISFFFITPKYSSTIDLLVNQKATNTQAQFTAQQADLQAINTYKDVLQKSVILNPVLKKARQEDNYRGSFTDLQKSVSISNQTNSQVLSVTVTDKNAYVAADIANDIGSVFTDKIKKMMKIDNVTVVTKATPNVDPVSPNKKLNILFGIVIGIVIGALIVLIREMLDTTVKDSTYLTDDLGLINLGFVYHIDSSPRDYHVVEAIIDDEGDENRRV